MTDAVTSAVYISALDELARRYSLEKNVQPDSVITLESLTDALAEDLEADGTFDGLGFLGIRIKLRWTPLTKDTVRTDLALAMLRFADQGTHQTMLTRQEVQPLALATSAPKGPLFSEDARRLQLDGPRLTGCQTVTARGHKRPLEAPIPGAFQVVCFWEDAVGVATSFVRATSQPERVLHETERYQAASIVLVVDTTDYEAEAYSVTVAAENREGSATEELITLQVDNRPPQLTLRRSAVWTNGQTPAVVEICNFRRMLELLT